MGGPSDLTLNLRFGGGAIGNYTAVYRPFPLPDEDNAMRLYGADGVMVVADRRVTVHRPDGTATEHRVEMPDGGYYNDKLVRTADGWRIAERIEEPAYTTRRHRIAGPGEMGV